MDPDPESFTNVAIDLRSSCNRTVRMVTDARVAGDVTKPAFTKSMGEAQARMDAARALLVSVAGAAAPVATRAQDAGRALDHLVFTTHGQVHALAAACAKRTAEGGRWRDERENLDRYMGPVQDAGDALFERMRDLKTALVPATRRLIKSLTYFLERCDGESPSLVNLRRLQGLVAAVIVWVEARIEVAQVASGGAQAEAP